MTNTGGEAVKRVFVKVFGFDDVERHALNTVFRLSETRPVAYALWLLPGNIQAPANLLRLAFAAHKLPAPRDVIPCQSIAVALAIIAESDSVDAARQALAEFPLAKVGLIDWEIIPLGPFVGWESLFASRDA